MLFKVMNCNASLNKFPFLSIVCFIIFPNHPFVNTRCELFRVQADLGMMDKFKTSLDYELTGVKKNMTSYKNNILKMVQTFLSLPVNKLYGPE